jgi:hypothetical protein
MTAAGTFNRSAFNALLVRNFFTAFSAYTISANTKAAAIISSAATAAT